MINKSFSKRRNLARGIAAFLVGGVILAPGIAPEANAASLTWDANNTGAGQTDGAGTWTNANQWWDGVSNATWNSATPDDATIGNGGAGGAISLGGSVTAGTISMGNNTGTYTVQGTAHTLTVNTGITIGGSGNVTFRGTAAGTPLTLTGAGGISMNGTGVLNLRENVTQSYTGATVINNGVVLLIGASKSTGNFTLNGGMLTDYFQQTGVFSSGLGTGNNQIQIYGNSGFGAGNGTSTWRIGATGSTLVWGASGEGSATGFFNPTTFKLRAPAGDNNGPAIFGTPNIDNRLDLNSGARTIDVFLGSGNIGGSRATIDDGIQDTGATGSLTKTGGGMLIINGSTSTWGANTNVNSGILFLGANNENNIGGGSARNIAIALNAGIQFNGLSNAHLNRIVETSNEISVMTSTTNNNLDFSSSTGANLPNAFLGNYATNGAKMEYGGTLTPASDNYRLGARGNSGLLGMLNTAPMTGTQGLIVGYGSVELVGAKTFTGTTVVNNGARLGLAAITGGGGNALGLQNSVFNVGAPANTGTFWLESAPAGFVTGAVATTSATFGGLQGSRNLASVYSTTTGANNSAATAVAGVTGFTLNLGNSVTASYSGVIANFATGTTITKTGAGTQAFTGVNTYTGATDITGGKLTVGGAGSINSSSGVTINGATANLNYNSSTALTSPITFTAGTLSGTGTINTPVTVPSGGIVAPGNSAGNLTFAAGADLSAGGVYNWELGALSVINPGTDFDTITVSGGNLALGGTSALTLDFNLVSATDPNSADVFWTSSKTWKIVDVTTGTNTGDTNLSTITNATYTSGTFATNVGTGGDLGDIFLVFTPSVGGPIQWDGGGDGVSWSDFFNWSPDTVPNGPTATANFVGAGSVTNVNTVAQTLNALNFNSTSSFTIGGNSVSMAGTTPTITNTAGSNTISAPLNLGNNTAITVNGGTLTLDAPTNATLGANVTATVAVGATLNLGGAGNALSNNTTTHANVTNNGTLAATTAGKRVGHITGTGTTNVNTAGASLTASSIRQGSLNIGAANTVTVAPNGGNTGVSQVTNLSINATGKLDLKDNDLIVDNGNLTALTALVNSGLDIYGTFGSGPGITSTTAGANPSGTTALGIAANSELGYTTFGVGGLAVDANDVLIKYTYFGDADLSGTVDNSVDFDLYITGLTSGGSLGGWLYGDFDYNGTVDNSTDFDLYITGVTGQSGMLLTAGFGSGSLTVNPVPEPGSLALLAAGICGAGALLRRRRRAASKVSC